MSSGCQRTGLLRPVIGEHLLAGHTNEFTPIPLVDFRGVSSKPSNIAIKLRTAKPCLRHLCRIGHFFHHNC